MSNQPKLLTNSPVKKKKKRKSRYKTGTYISSKCKTSINYRSSWEYVICLYLDEDPDVVEYAYESVIIPYISNMKSGRVRRYFPDFLITYSDGRQILAEVKRQNQINNILVKKKAEAAKLWCENQNPPLVYEFWTDKMILPLQRAYKIREGQKVSKTKKKKPKKK